MPPAVGRWRGIARQVIADVLARTTYQPAADRLRAIDRAYPFGARAHFPYTAWLTERKQAMIDLGLAAPTISAKDAAKLERWHRDVAAGQLMLEPPPAPPTIRVVAHARLRRTGASSATSPLRPVVTPEKITFVLEQMPLRGVDWAREYIAAVEGPDAWPDVVLTAIALASAADPMTNADLS